jgi:hypothetical protein
MSAKLRLRYNAFLALLPMKIELSISNSELVK